MATMRALVLGGNGFIGSHLVDRLLVEGVCVRVFDRQPEMYRRPLDRVDYRYGDFGNRALLTEALTNIDLVFHLIGTTVPQTSNDDPIFDVMSNVVETIYLLEQCVKMNIKKIVFLSSGGTVYGIPQVLPVSEDAPTNPLCSYGITKLTIEKYLYLFHHLYGLSYAVIRPSNPYGPRQNPKGIQGAVAVFLGRVARGEVIEVWGDGKIIRDYVFVQDLVDGIYRSAISAASACVYNLGSGEGYSLNYILEIIQRVVGCRLTVHYAPARSFDVPRIYLDNRRARQELGWSPKTTLETGIAETWKFVSSNVR